MLSPLMEVVHENKYVSFYNANFYTKAVFSIKNISNPPKTAQMWSKNINKLTKNTFVKKIKT